MQLIMSPGSFMCTFKNFVLCIYFLKPKNTQQNKSQPNRPGHLPHNKAKNKKTKNKYKTFVFNILYIQVKYDYHSIMQNLSAICKRICFYRP